MRFTLRRMMVAVAFVSLLLTAGIAELDRRRLRDSLTVEGEVAVGGKPIASGTVYFVQVPGEREFAAGIRDGRYSMRNERIPVGLYRIEVESTESSVPRTTRGRGTMPLDPGSHRINLAY